MSLCLIKNCSGSISQLKYSHIIDSFIYLINCIRFDIVYLIYKLNIHDQSIGEPLESIDRVLKYLNTLLTTGCTIQDIQQ